MAISTDSQLREDANAQLYGGWPMILLGIKTMLETGDILTTTRIAALVARRQIKREFGVCLKTGPRFGSHKQVQSDARIIVHRNPGIRDTEHLGYRRKDFLNRRTQRGKPQPK
jgi:hypothetical protein